MSRMARRPRRGSVDQEQHRPVGRQPARHQVVEQRRRDRRRLGRTFAQSEDVFAPRCVDPQRDHDAVFLEDLAVDADHTQIQLAQRPADECPQLLGRQCHKPAATRRCAMWPARSPRPAPGPACAHTAASTPPRRSPRTCATPTRRWPPPTGSSPPAPRPRRCPPEAAAARPVAPRASRGSPRSRHATRSAQADDGRSFGPHNASRSASCIAWSICIPVAMHSPWNACRTSPSTASTSSGTWIETERELGGWRGRIPDFPEQCVGKDGL